MSFVLRSVIGSTPINESFLTLQSAVGEAFDAFRGSYKTPVYIKQNEIVIYDYAQLLNLFKKSPPKVKTQ